jgi:hypothetical protein
VPKVKNISSYLFVLFKALLASIHLLMIVLTGVKINTATTHTMIRGTYENGLREPVG